MVKRMSVLAEAEAEAINGRSGGWLRQQIDVGVVSSPVPTLLFCFPENVVSVCHQHRQDANEEDNHAVRSNEKGK